jgi:hypothetical protein
MPREPASYPRRRARGVDWPDARRQQIRAIPPAPGKWQLVDAHPHRGAEGRARGRPTPGLQRPGVRRLGHFPAGKRRGTCLGSSAAQLSGGEQAAVTKVKQGLAIINTTPRYDSEAAAGTGMVINADGLVLTNNQVVDDSANCALTSKRLRVRQPARRTSWPSSLTCATGVSSRPRSSIARKPRSWPERFLGTGSHEARNGEGPGWRHRL